MFKRCLSSLPCPGTLSTNFHYVLQVVHFSYVKELCYPRVICSLGNIWHICFFIVSGWVFFRNHEGAKSTIDGMRCQSAFSKPLFFLFFINCRSSWYQIHMGDGDWGMGAVRECSRAGKNSSSKSILIPEIIQIIQLLKNLLHLLFLVKTELFGSLSNGIDQFAVCTLPAVPLSHHTNSTVSGLYFLYQSTSVSQR